MSIGVTEKSWLDDDYVPVLRSDTLVRHYGNEAIAWSPARSAPTFLDPVAAIVLQVIDGQASVNELISDVHEVLDIPRDIAAGQIGRVLRAFGEAEMLGGLEREQDDVGVPPTVFHDPPNN